MNFVFKGKTMKVEFRLEQESGKWMIGHTLWVRGATDINWNGKCSGKNPEEGIAKAKEFIERITNQIPNPPIKKDIDAFEKWEPEVAGEIKKEAEKVNSALERFEADSEFAEFEAEREGIAQKEIKLAEKQEEKAKQKAETAEANKLDGSINSFCISSDFSKISAHLCLKKMRDEKLYQFLPERETWDKYCASLGLSRRHVDEQIENLNVFG
jgi:hypothetical protein